MQSLVQFFESLRFDCKQLFKYRYVISSYVIINLRMRYRRSAIGFCWTIVTPLLQYLVIALVFMYLLKSRRADFFPYFFAGSAIFNVLSIAIQRAPAIMLANEMYIKKIYLPKFIYVLNTCLYELTNFGLAAMTLWVLGLVFGYVGFSISLMILPLCLLNLILMLLGLSAILSVGGVFFRDLLYIVPQVMQATFFFTPIIYTPDMFPQWLQQALWFNPFYHLIETFREPIINGHLASLDHYFFSTGFAAATFAAGFFVIKKFDNRIIFKL